MPSVSLSKGVKPSMKPTLPHFEAWARQSFLDPIHARTHIYRVSQDMGSCALLLA